MAEASRRRTCFVEGVIKCYPDETLDAVIERIVKAEVEPVGAGSVQRRRGHHNHNFFISLRFIGWSWWTGLT